MDLTSIHTDTLHQLYILLNPTNATDALKQSSFASFLLKRKEECFKTLVVLIGPQLMSILNCTGFLPTKLIINKLIKNTAGNLQQYSTQIC